MQSSDNDIGRLIPVQKVDTKKRSDLPCIARQKHAQFLRRK